MIWVRWLGRFDQDGIIGVHGGSIAPPCTPALRQGQCLRICASGSCRTAAKVCRRCLCACNVRKHLAALFDDHALLVDALGGRTVDDVVGFSLRESEVVAAAAREHDRAVYDKIFLCRVVGPAQLRRALGTETILQGASGGAY